MPTLALPVLSRNSDQTGVATRLCSRAVDEAQLDAAAGALRRLGVDGALRAADHLELAVKDSLERGTRWQERLSFSLREALEEVPLLFGQQRQSEPLVPIARDLIDSLNGLIDVPAEARLDTEQVGRLLVEFEESVDEVAADRRVRIARAMMVQARTGQPSAQVDAFAKEWAEVVRDANSLLHTGAPSTEDAEIILSRGIGLLAALVVPLSDRLEDIDAMANIDDPTEPEVQQLTRLLADERLARYFYTQKAASSWLYLLDRAGSYDPPIDGDWYEGALLVRAAEAEPGLAIEIVGRFTRDPHPAAPVVVVDVVERLGPDHTPHLVQALDRPDFVNSWAVTHSLEELLRSWSRQGWTEAFPRIADVVLEPLQAEGSSGMVRSRFGESDFQKLVVSIVEYSDCSIISELTQIIAYKVRRLVTLTASRGLMLSLGRESIEESDRDSRDAGNALISGLRDALRRMRECGETLDRRQAAIGGLDNELAVRIWAGHLAEEGGAGS